MTQKYPLRYQSLTNVCNGLHIYQLMGWQGSIVNGGEPGYYLPPTIEELSDVVNWIQTKAIMVVQNEQTKTIQFLESLEGTPTAAKMWLEARRIAPWSSSAKLWMIRCYRPDAFTWDTCP